MKNGALEFAHALLKCKHFCISAVTFFSSPILVSLLSFCALTVDNEDKFHAQGDKICIWEIPHNVEQIRK